MNEALLSPVVITPPELANVQRSWTPYFDFAAIEESQPVDVNITDIMSQADPWQ